MVKISALSALRYDVLDAARPRCAPKELFTIISGKEEL